MKSLSLIFFLFILLINLFPQLAYSKEENGEQGCFVVTGHILNKKVEVGINQQFLRKAVPFINGIHPDFLILTGDMIKIDDLTGNMRPVETIRRQYDFIINEVFGKIETEIYCLAGNHDTGKEPYLPSIQLFENLINPLYFSFEYKGSLFLFLSLYQPFYHMDRSGIFPARRFDTPSSRIFLDNLRSKCQNRYDHIFVFVHFSPISDFPNGYYWSHFLTPLFANFKQDIHIFSTVHYNKNPFSHNVNQVMRYNNIYFYCFASFPRGTYTVHFNNHDVRVDLLQGGNFIPALIQEIVFQPTTRLSMIRRCISFWLIDCPEGMVIYYSLKYFGKTPRAVLKNYYHKLTRKIDNYLDKFKDKGA